MGDAEVDLDSIIDRLVAGEWHCSLIPSPGAPRKMALCAVDAGCFNAPGPLRVHEIRQRKGVLGLNILHHVPPPHLSPPSTRGFNSTIPFLSCILRRLLERTNAAFYSTVRRHRPGRSVDLEEYEIKYLCVKSQEIFMNQPMLLELEAPLKICGTYARNSPDAARVALALALALPR